MTETRAYDSAEYLDTPEMITEYLTEALETNDMAFIARAVDTVARARGMTDLAHAAGVSRADLYLAVGGEAGLQLGTIRKVLDVLGVRTKLVVNEEVT